MEYIDLVKVSERIYKEAEKPEELTVSDLLIRSGMEAYYTYSLEHGKTLENIYAVSDDLFAVRKKLSEMIDANKDMLKAKGYVKPPVQLSLFGGY